MKTEYIEQVKNELAVSRKWKKEIERDLHEAFASAVEHGETEQAVILRLGSPREFANSIHEQLGIGRMERRRKQERFKIGFAAMIMILAFSLSGFIQSLRVPRNVIGQADGTTSIKIEAAAIDPILIFVLLGTAALSAAVVFGIRYIRRK